MQIFFWLITESLRDPLPMPRWKPKVKGLAVGESLSGRIVMEFSLSKDVPIMSNYLVQINSQLEKIRAHADLLEEHVLTQKFEAKEGVDLLGLKNELLLRFVLVLCEY